MSSEELWRGLVVNAPMGILIVSEGRIAYLNPDAIKLFGANTAGEMIGKSVMEFISHKFHDMIKNQSEMLVVDKKPVSAVEQIWQGIDNTQIGLVISAAPIVYDKTDSALFFIREIL